MKYDILDELFVHCVFQDGSCRRLSLMGTLRQAGQITDLRHPCPQDDFAVYRFLLALLAWMEPCRDAVKLRQRWNHGLPESLLDNVKKMAADRFDLFHRERPFLQHVAVRSQKSRPVADLIPELPADTAINHFAHIYAHKAGLCPACCLHGMLRLPVFCTQGGQGKAPSINDAPPVYLLPIGPNLLETFLLNWPERSMSGDLPCWEGTTTEEAIGWMEGFTWQPRHVWLPEPSVGYCVLCGSPDHGVIREIVFVKGRMRSAERSRSWRDPHAAFFLGKGRKAVSLRGPEPLKSPNAAAGLWRQVAKAVLQSLDKAEDSLGVQAVQLAAARLEAGQTLCVRCFIPFTRQEKTLDGDAMDWHLPSVIFRKGEQVAALLIKELDRLDNAVQSLEKCWLRTVLSMDANQKPKRKAVEGVSWLRMARTEFESGAERLFRHLLARREMVETWWGTICNKAQECFVEPAVRMAAGSLEQCELRHRMEAAIADSFKREDA